MVEKSRTKMGSSVFVRREERESEHHHFRVFLNFDEQRKPFAAPSFFSFLSAAGLSLSQELLHTSQHQQHQQHQHQQQHPSEETWPVSRRGERERRREQRRRKQRGASRASVLFSSDLSLLSLSSPPSTLPHETKAADTWARDYERAEQLAADVANAIQVRARARERGKTMKELFHRRRRCLFFFFLSLFRPPIHLTSLLLSSYQLPPPFQERNTRHPDGGPGASRLSANARRGLGTLGAALDGLRAAAAADDQPLPPSPSPSPSSPGRQPRVTEAERHRRLDAVAALRARREALLLQLRRPASDAGGNAGGGASSSQEQQQQGQQRGQQQGQQRPRETAETAPLDSVALLDSQRQAMDRQDRELEGLEKTVRSTRHVALAVGEELELQSGLLEALDDDVGATGARLRAAGRQLAAVARRPGECRSLCTGLLALFVAAVVAVLLIRIVRLL